MGFDKICTISTDSEGRKVIDFLLEKNDIILEKIRKKYKYIDKISEINADILRMEYKISNNKVFIIYDDMDMVRIGASEIQDNNLIEEIYDELITDK